MMQAAIAQVTLFSIESLFSKARVTSSLADLVLNQLNIGPIIGILGINFPRIAKMTNRPII